MARRSSKATRAVLRVVIASPSDVPVERDSIATILDDLNRGIAADYAIHLTSL